MKSQKSRYRKELVIVIVITSLFIAIFFSNYKDTNFMDAKFKDILTLFIAVYISYFLVQRNTGHRMALDKIDKMLYKIQAVINAKDFISIETDEIKQKNLIIHRTTANKINYLKKYMQSIKVEQELLNDVAVITSEFEKLRELYSEHLNNSYYLDTSYKEITNGICRIDDACDHIHLLLIN